MAKKEAWELKRDELEDQVARLAEAALEKVDSTDYDEIVQAAKVVLADKEELDSGGDTAIRVGAAHYQTRHYETVIEQKGETLDHLEEEKKCDVELEHDAAAFKKGYDSSVSQEPKGTGIRRSGSRTGIWCSGEDSGKATYVAGGEKKTMSLGWLGATKLVKKIMTGEFTHVKIGARDQGLLYANVERALDILLTNRGQPATFERSPMEAVAGLYLLGKLNGMKTPEIKRVVAERPLLKKIFEAEIARIYTGFVEPKEYPHPDEG